MDLKRAQKIAKDLMAFHGLHDYAFKFDNSVRRFGVCNHRHHFISISRKLTLLNDESHVVNVILHEIAHALTEGDNHGTSWERVAITIGCDAKRLYDHNVIAQPPRPYVGRCPGCGRESQAFRRRDVSCGKCSGGVYNKRFKIQWRKA